MALKTISLNTGNKTVAEFDNAVSIGAGYTDTIPDPANPGQTMPNPESKAAFVRKQFVEFYQRLYEAGLVEPAKTTALINKGIIT